MPNNEPKVRASSLHDLLHDNTYWIPPFQRGYAWEEAHVTALYSDLFEFWTDHRDDGSPYVLGQVIVTEAPTKEVTDGYKWSLIDGQQRVTTLLLFFATLKRRLEEIKEKGLVPPQIQHAWDNAEFQVRNIVSFQPNDITRPMRPRLKSPTSGADSTIESFIVGAEPPAATNAGVQRMIDSYDILYTAIESQFPDDDFGALPNFVEMMKNRVFVIRLEVDSTSDALTVFERINNRGIALDNADLLRNVLFANSNESDYAKISAYWLTALTELHKIQQKRIASMPFLLRALALRQGSNVPQNGVLKFWREKIENNQQDSVALSAQLADEAKVLVSITRGLDHSGQSSDITAGSQHLRFIQHTPILLQAWWLGQDLYAQIASLLEDRVVLSVLSNERNSGFERYVPRLMSNIAKLDINSTSDDVKQCFRDAESKEDFYLVHDKAKIGVLGLSYDKSTARRRQRYVLARISRATQKSAGVVVSSWETLLKPQKETSNNGFHLDHVYPKSLDGAPTLKNHLGNLMLLTAPYNQGLQDKLPSHPQKKQAYQDCGLVVAKVVAGGLANGNEQNNYQAVISLIKQEFERELQERKLSGGIGSAMDNWSDDSVAALGETYWTLFTRSFGLPSLYS